jgi:hypothetical protein
LFFVVDPLSALIMNKLSKKSPVRSKSGLSNIDQGDRPNSICKWMH